MHPSQTNPVKQARQANPGTQGRTPSTTQYLPGSPKPRGGIDAETGVIRTETVSRPPVVHGVAPGAIAALPTPGSATQGAADRTHTSRDSADRLLALQAQFKKIGSRFRKPKHNDRLLALLGENRVLGKLEKLALLLAPPGRHAGGRDDASSNGANLPLSPPGREGDFERLMRDTLGAEFAELFEMGAARIGNASRYIDLLQAGEPALLARAVKSPRSQRSKDETSRTEDRNELTGRRHRAKKDAEDAGADASTGADKDKVRQARRGSRAGKRGRIGLSGKSGENGESGSVKKHGAAGREKEPAQERMREQMQEQTREQTQQRAPERTQAQTGEETQERTREREQPAPARSGRKRRLEDAAENPAKIRKMSKIFREKAPFLPAGGQVTSATVDNPVGGEKPELAIMKKMDSRKTFGEARVAAQGVVDVGMALELAGLDTTGEPVAMAIDASTDADSAPTVGVALGSPSFPISSPAWRGGVSPMKKAMEKREEEMQHARHAQQAQHAQQMQVARKLEFSGSGTSSELSSGTFVELSTDSTIVSSDGSLGAESSLVSLETPRRENRPASELRRRPNVKAANGDRSPRAGGKRVLPEPSASPKSPAKENQNSNQIRSPYSGLNRKDTGSAKRMKH